MSFLELKLNLKFDLYPDKQGQQRCDFHEACTLKPRLWNLTCKENYKLEYHSVERIPPYIEFLKVSVLFIKKSPKISQKLPICDLPPGNP